MYLFDVQLEINQVLQVAFGLLKSCMRGGRGEEKGQGRKCDIRWGRRALLMEQDR